MHDWQDDAACIGMETELFFDYYEADGRVAKETDSVCHSCPVRMQCLSDAIRLQSTGVFGGIYLVRGKFSKSTNNHKSKEQIAYETELVRKMQ